MRILMTQRELCHRGGSEMFTIEVAVELSRRGHQVAVFTPRFNDLAKFMLAGGVWVESRLADIPWVPEIIHGQHHLQAVAAMTRFDHVPAIYHCHGLGPWVEKPPLHPRIRYYAMMSSAMALRAEPEFGLPRERIVTISNFVNLVRFSQVRTPAFKLQRALVFGNDRLSSDERFRLEDACTQQGLTLEYIGSGYGNALPEPETFLFNYDLVFASGKCAIEALASGCAVIPLSQGGIGHLITPENFVSWAATNFCPPYYFRTEGEISAAWLQRELLHYAPEGVTRVCERLRQEHGMTKTVDRLEALYQKVLLEEAKDSEPAQATELAPYLEKIGAEIDLMYVESVQTRSLHARIKELQREVQILRLKNKARQYYLRPFRRLLGKFRSLIPDRQKARSKLVGDKNKKGSE